MLKFTERQIADLSVRMFAERVQARLRPRFPQAFAERRAGDLPIERLVLAWIAEALSLGVVNAPDVEFYVQCKVLFGQDFALGESTRWAAAILARQDLDGESKMDLIDDHMLFGLEEPV